MNTAKDINISINLNLRNDLEKFIKNKLSKEELNKLGVFPQDEQLEIIKNERLDKLITIYNRLQNRLLYGNKKVILCNSLLKNKLYPTYNKIICEFKDKLENGESLSEYLSNTIDDLYFRDPIMQDWNINHLHFIPRNENRDYSKHILFVMSNENIVYFINIMCHEFRNICLLKNLYDHSSVIFEKYKLNNFFSNSLPSSQTIKRYRELGVSYSISFDDNTYDLSLNPSSEFNLILLINGLNIKIKEYEELFKNYLTSNSQNQNYSGSYSIEWLLNENINHFKISNNKFEKTIIDSSNEIQTINNILKKLKIL